MNDVATQIVNLLVANGKSAPQMTSALKLLGDGSMQKGITKVASYFAKNGLKKGRFQGAIWGFAGSALLAVIAYLINQKVKNDQNLQAEGEAILKVIEEELANDTDSGSTCDYIEEEVREVDPSTLRDNQ